MLAIALGVLVPGRASAEGSGTLELNWDAPAECPSEHRVRARVLELAGGAERTTAPLHADAAVTRRANGGLRLELVVRAGELVGTRRIDASSCDDLAGAAAVALALLLRSPATITQESLAGEEQGRPSSGAADTKGDDATAGGVAAAGSGSPAAPASIAAPPPAAPVVSTVTDRSSNGRRWRLRLQAPLAGLRIGPLPEPSLGVSIAAGVSVERWTLVAEGAAWASQRLKAQDPLDGSADLQLVTVGARACRAVIEGDLQLDPCVTLAAEHLRAEGSGDRITSRAAAATWLGVGAGAQARWRVAPWFALLGGLFGQIEASRPRIAIEGVGILAQTAPVSARLILGTEWIL